MSAFVPTGASGLNPEQDHPTLRQRPLDIDERRARWEVRAAQWRARELAEIAFGGVGETSLVGLRTGGTMRGVLRLDVPFFDLDDHREKEAWFMAAIDRDPVLSQVPLVYVVGPDAA